jgi:hypothetical protein
MILGYGLPDVLFVYGLGLTYFCVDMYLFTDYSPVSLMGSWSEAAFPFKPPFAFQF